MTIADIWNLISQGGLPVIALLILIGGHKKWWVFGWQYTELQTQLTEWRELALNGTLAADKALGLAERVTRSVPRDSTPPNHEERRRGTD